MVTTRNLISEKVNKVPPSGIRKFFDLLASMKDVISLGVGEPDFATPWNITEAAINSMEKGFTHYTSNKGMPELRNALSRYLKAKYDLQYDPETELLITVGVSEGMDLAMRSILEPDDEVLLPDPCFGAYPATVVFAGGTPVTVPTNCETGFKLHASDLESKLTPQTKAIFMGYPANPTGAVMDRRGLMDIADVAKRHDLLVLSDEIYGQLVYGVEHTCFASLPGMRDHTILLGGFSKAYAMTGWRIGYAAGRAEIIAAMTKIHQYTMMCVSTMAQIAAVEALRSGETAVDKMVREYNRRRRVMVKGLNEIGLTCFEPKGAFYTFPSVSVTGMSGDEFAEGLLKEEKVAVVPGSAFGQAANDHVRCCYATSLSEIEEALKRMGRFVEKHRRA